jgi:trk system potassium uptake protein TrkA
MRVIIVGAGEVGFQISKVLTAEGIEVIVVDRDKKRLKRVSETLDVSVVVGEGGVPSILEEAGAREADILLAVTDMDETNMIACLVAKVMFKIPRNVARIRSLEYINNDPLLKSLGIDPAINPEVEAGKAVVRLIEAPFASDVDDFEDGRVKVIGFRVSADSSLIGEALKYLNLSDPKILIGAIQRGRELIIPTGNDTIRKDDVIFLVIKSESIEGVCRRIGAETRPARRIMIVGGGRVGYYVAKTLEERDVSVKVIEKDEERCKFLLQSLKKSVILLGDGSNENLLEEENISDMDLFAAMSNNEELNIMASLLARSLGAKKVITIVNRTDYLQLARNLGLEAVLCPRLITASKILRYIRSGNIISLTTVAGGKAEIMEAEVKEGSVLAGKSLLEGELPKRALIGAIIRDSEIIIPSGNDRITENDKLIVFTLKESIRQVEKLLQ